MTDEYDHPFDLDEMDRDPTDDELGGLTHHQIAELYRDLSRGLGTDDLHDRVLMHITGRFDQMEADGMIE